jgi:hypothetical protein
VPKLAALRQGRAATGYVELTVPPTLLAVAHEVIE